MGLSGSNALSYQQQGLAGNKTTLVPRQINTWTADWVEFYTQHRLGYQFQRALGGHFPQQERLLAAIPNCWHTNLNPP